MNDSDKKDFRTMNYVLPYMSYYEVKLEITRVSCLFDFMENQNILLKLQ